MAYFKNPVQIKFHIAGEEEEAILGGIAYQHFIICGCCGEAIDVDDIDWMETYDSWMDISEEIMGN